jgi:carbon-monoxide dehydrogenase small subunit
MLAVQIDGKEITTVEGLSHGEELSALQKSFHKHHALQCGFCTPGLLTTVHAFLSSNNTPTSGQIRDVISGNLCRCTGYVNIVEAIEEAAEAYRGQP